MTLAERLTGQAVKPRNRCAIGVYLAMAQDPDEHAALLAALEFRTAKRWSADALAGEMRADGMPVSATTIRKHRTGVCICDRSQP